MLLDKQNQFSDAQEVKSTAASTNIVEVLKGALKEISFGQQIPLLVQVVEEFKGATSVKVAVQTSDKEDFSSPTTLIETSEIPVVELKAGYKFPINFVPKGNKSYMRLYYTVNGSATAGKITAGVVAAHDNSYQDM